MAKELGQLLISENIISDNQLNKALDMQKAAGGRLGTNLVKLGYLTEEKLVSFLSKQFGVPAINLADYTIDPNVTKLIPAEMAKKYIILPVARVGATLTIAMTDPSNVFAIDDVKFMTGYNVEVAVSSESAIVTAISQSYGGGARGAEVATTTTTETDPDEASKILAAKDYTLSDDEEVAGGAFGD